MSKQILDSNYQTDNLYTDPVYLPVDNEDVLVTSHESEHKESTSYDPYSDSRITVYSGQTNHPITLFLNYGIDPSLSLIKSINKKFTQKR